MTTALMKPNTQLPAAVAKLAALAISNPAAMQELTGGVTSGFSVLRYKGKTWSYSRGGETVMHLDANGMTLPYVDVVLIQANPLPSKIFYDKQYEEGSNEPPRCFSNDGIKPDASVQNPISPACASCPHNVWGSRITPQGKKSRLCSDARRMAVVFAHDLYENGVDAEPFLLRVPPASLNPLKDYAEKTLAPKGIPFFGIVTRISFDPQAAHPQFVFKPARFVNDEEADAIAKLRGSPDVLRILAEAQEFAAGGAANGAEASQSAGSAAAPAAAAAPRATTPPAANKPAAKPRPATEEEAGDTIMSPPPARNAAPAPAPAPAPVQTAPTDPTEPAPAPAPRRRKQTAAAAPAAPAAPVQAPPVVEEDESAPAATQHATPPANFDNLLDQILNG